jgi:hypothetical protein
VSLVAIVELRISVETSHLLGKTKRLEACEGSTEVPHILDDQGIHFRLITINGTFNLIISR